MTDKLRQNPHALREQREKNLEVAIGRQVRELRKHQRMTGADLAAKSGLSVGMLSKIENGATSPSLTTISTLAHALGVPVVQLFSGYEEDRACLHVKAGQGSPPNAKARGRGINTVCLDISARPRRA